MNFFDAAHLEKSGKEQIELLLKLPNAYVERIVSNGQASPEGFWYTQETDEWIIVMQGHAVLEFEEGVLKTLETGDFMHIPKGKKHRVARVSTEPNVFWLAVHIKS